MEPIVTEEQLARQTPESQAIIRLLLAKIVKMEAEIEVLRSDVYGLHGACHAEGDVKESLTALPVGAMLSNGPIVVRPSMCQPNGCLPI